MDVETESKAPGPSASISRQDAIALCIAAGLSAAAAGQTYTRLTAKAREVHIPVPWRHPADLAQWYETYYSSRGLPLWLRNMTAAHRVRSSPSAPAPAPAPVAPSGTGPRKTRQPAPAATPGDTTTTAPPAPLSPSSSSPPPPPDPASLANPVEFLEASLAQCQQRIQAITESNGQDASIVALTKQYADLLDRLDEAKERAAAQASRTDIPIDRAAAILDQIHGTILRHLIRDLQSQRNAAARAATDPEPHTWAAFCEEFIRTSAQRLVDGKFQHLAEKAAAA